MALLNSRTPIDDALLDPNLSAEDKKKLLLAKEVREFSEKTLGLKASKNYSSFVKLERDAVTYVVSAAEKWQLKNYQWSYPFLGKMPYKGFFVKEDAIEEAESMKTKGFDVYLRGVSAYSTLGWFNDPIVSPMLKYSEEDFVDTLIHETVHVTLYIKNSSDFNERMAVFIANEATLQFYKDKEGIYSDKIKKIHDEKIDSELFSKFISEEIDELKNWYLQQTSNSDEESRRARIESIKTKFKEKLLPQLRTKSFQSFANAELNNARLGLYTTYTKDLNDFAELFELSSRDYRRFLEYCRSLEKHPHPEEGLKELISSLRQ